jgi:hypothetical protein
MVRKAKGETMKYMAWVLLGVLVPCVTFAGNAWQYSKRIERSMMVTGTIQLNPDGSLRGYTLDEESKLPPGVIEIIHRTLSSWKFQSMDDSGPLTASMSIRVIANKLDGDRYALGVKGVSFSTHAGRPDEELSYKNAPAPRYPEKEVALGAGGTVYAIARVNQQGNVEKVGVLQVDLHAIGNDYVMNHLRNDFAQAVLAAVAKWTFNVPKNSPGVDHWVVRIPIVFNGIYDTEPSSAEYGHWYAYVPGPVQTIPWLDPSEQISKDSADAIPATGLAFQDDKRLVLLNPPGNG